MAIVVGGLTVIDDSRNLQNIANLKSSLAPTAIKTAAYTAVANDLVRANTTAGGFAITFPASPADGDMIGVIDIASTFGTYPVAVLPNTGKTIEGDSTSLILDLNGAYASFVYNSSTTNWKLMETPIGALNAAPSGVLSILTRASTTTTVSLVAGKISVLTNSGSTTSVALG